MLEQRQGPRWLTLRTGTIHGASGNIECAILDISERGACLLIPVGAKVDTTFELTTDFAGESFLCRVIWASPSRIGIAFQSQIAEPSHVGLVQCP